MEIGKAVCLQAMSPSQKHVSMLHECLWCRLAACCTATVLTPRNPAVVNVIEDVRRLQREHAALVAQLPTPQRGAADVQADLAAVQADLACKQEAHDRALHVLKAAG